MKRCYLCGVESNGNNMTREHFIPRSHGGSNLDSNIFPACRRCNTLKADKMPTFVNLIGIYCTVILSDVLKFHYEKEVSFIQDNVQIKYSPSHCVIFKTTDFKIYKSSSFSTLVIKLIKKVNPSVSNDSELLQVVKLAVEDAFLYYINIAVKKKHTPFPESMVNNFRSLKKFGGIINE